MTSFRLFNILPACIPDIAVGAPYADSGFGSVYIYHGSADGINTTPAQVRHSPLSVSLFALLSTVIMQHISEKLHRSNIGGTKRNKWHYETPFPMLSGLKGFPFSA